MPPRRLPRVRVRTPRSGAPGPVPVGEEEPANHGSDSVELLGQDPQLIRKVRPGTELWKKLAANFRHFIEDVIEGWIAEGRTFPTPGAKKKAIGDLVSGTIERIKRNPRLWIEQHCDRG